MQIVEMLFPSPVGVHGLEENLMTPFSDYIKSLVNDGKTKSDYAKLNQITSDDLQTHKELKQLVLLIDDAVKQFSEHILALESDSLVLNSMWSNVQSSKHRHETHQHPNSFLSGVIYLQVPECEGGDLYFNDPRTAKNMFHGNFTRTSPISDRNWLYKTKTGMLVLFPSWLEHGTTTFIPKDENAKRISLSFNYSLSKCDAPTMRFSI